MSRRFYAKVDFLVGSRSRVVDLDRRRYAHHDDHTEGVIGGPHCFAEAPCLAYQGEGKEAAADA